MTPNSISPNSISPVCIELPFLPNSSVNVYLLPGNEPVLIDAGYNSDECWGALQSGLAQHNLRVTDLRKVIITHPHVDHYGLAARIVAQSGAEVWMAQSGVDWLRNFPLHMQQRIDYYRHHFFPQSGVSGDVRAKNGDVVAGFQRYLGWMERILHAWQPIPADKIVEFPIEQPIRLAGNDWQVLYLPGHDSTLVALHQPATGHLLSADALIIPTATPVLDAPAPGHARTRPLPEMVRSLQRLAALAVTTVYPGHGQSFDQHRSIIEFQVRRIHERKLEALAHIGDGAHRLVDVFARLYGPRATDVGMAGLWMALGYLDLLVEEGRIVCETVDDVWQFGLVG